MGHLGDISIPNLPARGSHARRPVRDAGQVIGLIHRQGAMARYAFQLADRGRFWREATNTHYARTSASWRRSSFTCSKVAPLSLIHISEPTRLGMISYAVFCLKKK